MAGVRRGSWQPPGRALVLVLVIVVLAAGCTWKSQEPGLFGNHRPTASEQPSAPSDGLNPDLPVLGQRTLTPDRPNDPSLRIALHAIRRTPGGTLLDWSITPLSDVSWAVGRDLDEQSTAATLAESASTFRIIDSDHRTVYDPLISTRTGGCLCSVPEGGLRIGITSLLQVAFPKLPSTLHSVSVELPGVELFTDVPVPQAHSYYGPTSPVDLARTPDLDQVIRWSPAFSYPPAGGQRFRIGIIAVLSASNATTVVWSIWSLTDGRGLRSGGAPPITSRQDSAAHRSTASGLQLVVPGSRSPITTWYESTGPARKREQHCLCTDLQSATTDLSRAQRSLPVITNLPPLPLRTQYVDVVLPGLGRITRVPVSEADDASSQIAGPIPDRSPTVPVPFGRWAAPSGNTWPTPRPSLSSFRHTRAVIGHLS